MAMLASKSPYSSNIGNASHSSLRNFSESSQRTQHATASSALQDDLFSSPTESEFSDVYDGLETVRAWDENKVATWLHSIRCGQYEPVFRANNFTGETLIECDQKILQEMGIKKIGDRVRINVAIKQLRNKSLLLKRTRNRDSMAALESYIATPSSSDSPRNRGTGINRRFSRQLDSSALHSYSAGAGGLKSGSRPSSPLAETHSQGLRAHRYAASPMENGRRDPSAGYFSQPSSANSTSGRRPETPQIAVQAARGPSHLRGNSSVDGLTAGGLPANSPMIKVIHSGGQTKVVSVKFCRNADDVTSTVLKKLLLPETHFRNYCFYVLSGLEADPGSCRRISDAELMRICNDSSRSERNRLIFRKINDGLPGLEELRKAAQLANDESQFLHSKAISSNNMRNQIKLQNLTGESWNQIKQPMSPITTTDRHRNIIQTADDLERAEAPIPRPARKDDSKLRSFFGARPPSEMIVQELTSYFPSHHREDIEKTMRMSVRRSQRMSRAQSRLSVMSNVSFASSLKDAPPVPSIPNIADAWLAQTGQPARTGALRPLSVSKFPLSHMSYRDSIASSMLQPLQEESPVEPNRKSYVSFDSGSESGNRSDAPRTSYFEADSPGGMTETGSLNQRLSTLVAEDGEEEDAALNSFLAGNSFDKNNWMKGQWIGEGSFGSVYLALHAVTGELMAVKQVELPNHAQGTESDKKKTTMINALKVEIDLLQGLRHPHIVQYLGTSSDETHLNIFLEYVAGGSIAGMLKQYNTFQEPLIRNFVRQILDGLSYLHGQNIIHRDIKGANVLVDNKGSIKISDFGISRRGDVAASANQLPGSGLNRPSLQGSVFWMAPEVVRQSAHTKKADIWSLGCLIVEMFSGARPFPDKSQLQALFAIGSNQAKPTIPETASEEAKTFMNKTFEIEHEKRPSADELLKDPFLVPIA
jgi:mitogen-activated protein kinase kinase kinase